MDAIDVFDVVADNAESKQIPHSIEQLTRSDSFPLQFGLNALSALYATADQLRSNQLPFFQTAQDAHEGRSRLLACPLEAREQTPILVFCSLVIGHGHSPTQD